MRRMVRAGCRIARHGGGRMIAAFMTVIVLIPLAVVSIPEAEATTGTYSSAVLADSPLTYYRLEDTGTVAADSSGNSHSGTISPDALHQETGALPFETDASLLGTSSEPALTGSIAGTPAPDASQSAELWVKGTADFCSGLSYLSMNGLTLQVDNGCVGGARLELVDSAGIEVAAANQLQTVADGSWHQIGFTVDSATSTTSLFVDGVVVATANTTLATTSTPLQTHLSTGSIDEVSVYSKALSPGRIAAHFTAAQTNGVACAPAPTSKYGEAVVADSPARFYELDEPTGSRVALDASGSCFNGARSDDATSVPGALFAQATTGLQSGPNADGLTATSLGLPSPGQSQSAEMWVRGTADFCSGLSYLGMNGLTLLVDNGCVGGARLELTDSTGIKIAANNQLPTIADGGWHQVGYTFDAATSTGSLFVDGSVVVTASGVSLDGASAPLRTLMNGSVDEVSIYGAALSASQIAAHYAAAEGADQPSISGTVTYAGSPAFAASVEACDAQNACHDAVTNTAGKYRVYAPSGAYTVTVLPPATGNGSLGTPYTGTATTTADQPQASLDVELQAAAIPSGSSLSSPTFGDQGSGVPTVTWTEPTTYRTTGCSNGFGELTIQSDADASQRYVALQETPVGSGNYEAQIPPLAPMHGQSTFSPSITCVTKTSTYFPGSGDASGGSKVLVHLTGPDVSAFMFGSSPATSFTTLATGIYSVVAPAGTGDVELTAKLTDGTTNDLGPYHYMAAQVQAAAGPANGTNTVTVTGTGLGSDSLVFFGDRLAQVTSSSATQLTVSAPSGEGQVPVFIASNSGFVSAGTYTYQGKETAPTGSDSRCQPLPTELCSPVETLTSLGAQATVNKALAGDDFEEFAKGFATDAAEDNLTSIAQSMIGSILGLDEHDQETLETVGTYTLPFGLEGAAIPVLGQVGTLIYAGAALALWAKHGGPAATWLDIYAIYKVLIDPSGTVVDRNGTPVPGAVVTLLRQGSDGSFSPVSNGDPTISPTSNPLTTGGTGAFSWLAAAGTYRVSASSADCTDATGGPAAASAGPFVIPPPALGIMIKLDCQISAPTQPVVTQLSKDVVQSGDTVTVAGQALGGATAVSVGGRAASSFAVLSPTALQVVLPAQDPGDYNLTVTGPGGTSAVTASARLTYTAITSPTEPTATTTTLSFDANPAQAGTNVAARVHVAANSGTATPTGQVVMTEGGSQIGEAAIDSSGNAQIPLSGLAAGTHTLSATYTDPASAFGSSTAQATLVHHRRPDQDSHSDDGSRQRANQPQRHPYHTRDGRRRHLTDRQGHLLRRQQATR